jgi:bifunctional DNA-binding transcriptional regulator/antitoxin component of YhaV-PrlF toxin-antitoxin module
MRQHTAIFEPDGSLVLPPEVHQTLGISPGSAIDLKLEDDGVWIPRQSRPQLSPAQTKAIIKGMQDLFRRGGLLS